MWVLCFSLLVMPHLSGVAIWCGAGWGSELGSPYILFGFTISNTFRANSSFPLPWGSDLPQFSGSAGGRVLGKSH